MDESHQKTIIEYEKTASTNFVSMDYSAGTDHEVPLHPHQRRSPDFSTQDDNSCKETLSQTDKASLWSDKLNGSIASPPSRQHIANVILQITAIVAAIAFGAFAVQSVHLANQANQYAATAANLSFVSNQLAMYAICISVQLQVCCTGGCDSIHISG